MVGNSFRDVQQTKYTFWLVVGSLEKGCCFMASWSNRMARVSIRGQHVRYFSCSPTDSSISIGCHDCLSHLRVCSGSLGRGWMSWCVVKHYTCMHWLDVLFCVWIWSVQGNWDTGIQKGDCRQICGMISTQTDNVMACFAWRSPKGDALQKTL